jgi:hypothetical protein
MMCSWQSCWGTAFADSCHPTEEKGFLQFCSVELSNWRGCTSEYGALESQYRFAQAIVDPKTRVETLAVTAESAACICDMATVRKVLQDLDRDPCHDRVAERCAFQLSNAGHPLAAREIARTIHESDKRKEALAKIDVDAAKTSDPGLDHR